MKSALQEFARQSDREILFSTDVVADKEASVLTGVYEDEEALELLLANSGLEYSVTASDTFLVVEERGRNETTDLSRQPTLMAMSSGDSDKASVAAAAERAARSDEADGTAEDDDDMEEIIVTGSQLIRDPGKMTRQVTVFNRAEIERSGATRLDEFLRRLPQNVNAPNNVGAGFPGGNDFGLGENIFAGSTINLRGLGSQYTLILINGRRPARGGLYGDVTDISSIPIDRIERIEVLFDGAAALYGADAVGGVVNIITRQDYGGTHLSLTYNDTEDGGGARTNLQLGHTFNWGSGSLTATVGYQTQEQIEGNQRADVPLSDGGDFGVFGSLSFPPSQNGNVRGVVSNFDFSNPEYRALFWVNGDERLSGGVEVPALKLVTAGEFIGQVVETTVLVDRQNPQLPFGHVWIDEAADRPQNPETLGFTPVFQADLPEYSDQPLGLGEVSASNELGESVEERFEGLALSPEDDTYNIGLTFVQDLSEDIRLTLNTDYRVTSKVYFNEERDGFANIPADNPSNPFGQPFTYMYKNLLPQRYRDIESTRYDVSGGIDWDFASDWNLAFGFGYSDDEQDAETINFLRSSGGLADTLESRLSGYYTVTESGVRRREFTGSSFNDPALGYGSVEEMIAALVIPFQRTYNHSTQYEADLRLLGKLFALPAGDVRISLLAGYREDESEVFSGDATVIIPADSPLEPGPNDPLDVDYNERFGENVKSLRAEVSVPVIDTDFDLPFVDSLLLSFAGALEEYSATEENGFNWAAGFNWGVNEQFIVRLNRTYSLRVPESVRTAQDPRWRYSPTLDLYADVNDQFPAAIVDEGNWSITGGANHLVPERNYGTALSFIYRPAFAEGLDIQMNLTQSRTVDQLGNPFMARNLTFDAVSPESVRANPLLDFGDPQNNAFHASAAIVIGGEVIRMAPGNLIFDRREYNIGDTFNRGADFQISYNLATRFGDWLLIWRHQYLDTNEVTRSNLCDQVVQGCNLDPGPLIGGVDEPIDTVGSVSRENFLGGYALPRNRGSVDLSWDYRGIGVNVFTQYATTTSLFSTEDVTEDVVIGYFEFNGQRIPITERQFVGTNVYRQDTRPEQTVNLSLSYDFARGSLFGAPGWLGDARIALTIDNLYQIAERKDSTVVVQAEAQVGLVGAEVNRFTLRPRGRAYTLLFSTTF